jgi:hypothetical protein
MNRALQIASGPILQAVLAVFRGLWLQTSRKADGSWRASHGSVIQRARNNNTARFVKAARACALHSTEGITVGENVCMTRSSRTSLTVDAAIVDNRIRRMARIARSTRSRLANLRDGQRDLPPWVTDELDDWYPWSLFLRDVHTHAVIEMGPFVVGRGRYRGLTCTTTVVGMSADGRSCVTENGSRYDLLGSPAVVPAPGFVRRIITATTLWGWDGFLRIRRVQQEYGSPQTSSPYSGQ